MQNFERKNDIIYSDRTSIDNIKNSPIKNRTSIENNRKSLENNRKSLENNRKSFGSMNEFTGSSIDYVNLKIAQRPVKFYKLVHCEKAKMHEYNHIIEKIKSICSNPHQSIIIYLKISTIEEIQINSESEWKNFFENSGRSIIELIDSKNTLKIEYFYSIENSSFQSINENSLNNLNLIAEYDKHEIDILKLIFKYALTNDSVKIKIRDVIQSDVNSRIFDTNLKSFFDKTLQKVHKMGLIKSAFIDEKNQTEDEIILNEEYNFSLDCKDDEQIDIPPFSEYYKNENIEVFRSKIISETFTEFNNKKY